MSTDLATQENLSPEVFGRFINLSVNLSLGGSTTFELEKLQEILGDAPLRKGAELVITSRYYIKDVRMPVERKPDYSQEYNSKTGGYPSVYELGGAKLDLQLLAVEKVEAKAAKIKQVVAAPCTCLVKIEPGAEKPEAHRAAGYPLKGYWADTNCPDCLGKGYVFPRANKAPLAARTHASGVVVLVDELPEPPDVPEGYCQECGQRGGDRYSHNLKCPVRKRLEAEEKAAQRADKKAKPAAAAPKGE